MIGYDDSKISVKLRPSNIASGVSILGVQGEFGEKLLTGQLQGARTILFSTTRNFNGQTVAPIAVFDNKITGEKMLWSRSTGAGLRKFDDIGKLYHVVSEPYPGQSFALQPFGTSRTIEYGTLSQHFFQDLSSDNLDRSIKYHAFLPRGYRNVSGGKQNIVFIYDHINNRFESGYHVNQVTNGPSARERTRDEVESVSSQGTYTSVNGLTYGSGIVYNNEIPNNSNGDYIEVWQHTIGVS